MYNLIQRGWLGRLGGEFGAMGSCKCGVVIPGVGMWVGVVILVMVV